MKVNLAVTIKNIKGEDLKDEEQEPMTLGKVITMACLAQLEDDNKKNTAHKVTERWKLAMDCHLHGNGEVDISVDMLKDLQERIPKMFGVLVAGQACDLIK